MYNGKQTPYLSVVLPCHNKAHELYISLQCLARQLLPVGESLELIIVDDSSNDSPENVIRSFKEGLEIQYEHVEVNSAAVARNVGARMANSEVVAFIDPDVAVSSSWAKEMHDAVLSGNHVVAIGELLATEWTPEMWTDAIGTQSDFEYIDSIERALRAKGVEDVRIMRLSQYSDSVWTSLWTANIALRSDLFQTIGGFDESFSWKGSEDLEFGYHLTKAEANFVYCSDATGIHIPHIRNRLAETRIDRQNVFKLLRRWPELPVELVVAFDCANQPEAYAWLKSFLVESKKDDHIPSEVWRIIGGIRSIAICGDFRIDPPETDTECEYLNPYASPKGLHLLGLHTPYADKSFDAVLLGPPLDKLPWRWLGRIFKEADRISHRIFLIGCTNWQNAAEYKQAFDQPYWELMLGSFCPEKESANVIMSSNVHKYTVWEIMLK